MAIAFLLGLLFGFLLRGGTIRRLRRELEDKQVSIDASQVEITRLTDELHLREADLRKAQFDTEEQKSKANRLTDEKTKLYNEIYSLNTEVERLNNAPQTDNTATVVTLQTTVDRQSEQISTLQARNTALENELAQLKTATPEPQEQTIDYLAEFQSTQNALRSRLEALESKMGNLATENTTLRTEVESLKTSNTIPQPAAIEQTPVDFQVEAEPIWNLGARQTPVQPLVETNAVERDDLTKIEGIGPFLERQLNDAGIYTYDQISHWDGADTNRITQEIRYFPGRIEREDWVGQAVQLQQQKVQSYDLNDNLNAAYPADRTDLTLIQGINTEVAAALRKAGINTWDDLAEADPAHLNTILSAAGENTQIYNPTTWTAQARLAAGGHWELLREYQEQLKVGKDIN